jgi:hypothetical protein
MKKYCKFVVDCIYAVSSLKFLKSLCVAVLCTVQNQIPFVYIAQI